MTRRLFVHLFALSTLCGQTSSKDKSKRRGVQAFYLVWVRVKGKRVQERVPVVVFSREDVRAIERIQGFIRWVPSRPTIR